MLVNNYKITFEDTDLRYLNTGYIPEQIIANNSNIIDTLDHEQQIIKEVPLHVVKGKLYHGVEAPKSKKIDSLLEYCQLLGLSFDWKSGELTTEEVEIEIDNSKDGGYQNSNTVPFIGNVVKGTDLVVTEVQGRFLFGSTTFKGFIKTDLKTRYNDYIDDMINYSKSRTQDIFNAVINSSDNKSVESKLNIDNMIKESNTRTGTIYNNLFKDNKSYYASDVLTGASVKGGIVYFNDDAIKDAIINGFGGDSTGVLIYHKQGACYIPNQTPDKKKILNTVTEALDKQVKLADSITKLGNSVCVQGSPLNAGVSSEMDALKQEINNINDSINKILKELV